MKMQGGEIDKYIADFENNSMKSGLQLNSPQTLNRSLKAFPNNSTVPAPVQ